MIELTYEQKQTIGYLYVTELLAPCSPYGQEKLRNLVPYTRDEADRLQQELDNLEALVKNRAETKSALNELMHVFMRMKHVGNALRRLRERPLTDVEFFECKNFLICTESAKKLTDALAGKIGLSGLRYEDTSEALALLDPDGRRIPSFAVYDSYSDKLRDIREQKRAIERKMEGSDADTWEKLKQERASLVMAEEQEEQQVRIRLTEDLRPFADRMKANTLVTADLDLLMEKARIASAKGAVRPVITTDALSFTNVRNPEVEAILSEKRLPFTPLSITLGTGAGLITGANM
ncbi:MAG: DNA mismatch repair protein MutS, partial [Butyrivibrio sp.]|nr:DNA mismatch repair protein MutS [Butyrivibrio sp.]